MKIAEIARVIEAVLFVSGDGVDRDEFKRIYDMSDKELNKCLDILKEKYSGDSGIHLIQYKNKMQLCSNPALADNVAEILNPIRERSLTKSALETVAIVAYKQPITRAEIEQIRGVNCDYAVQLLQNNNLIEVVGRKDAVGKPLLFGTTDNFLKRFELNSLEDLPNYKDLLDRIRVIHSEGDSLYREFSIPDEGAEANDNVAQDENNIDDKTIETTEQVENTEPVESNVSQDIEQGETNLSANDSVEDSIIEDIKPIDAEQGVEDVLVDNNQVESINMTNSEEVLQEEVEQPVESAKTKLSWRDKIKAKMTENAENYENLDSVLERK